MGLLLLGWYLGNGSWSQPATDTIGLSYLPFALLQHRTVFLSAYSPVQESVVVHGQIVCKYSVGTALTALPVYVPYVVVGGHFSPAAAAVIGKVSGGLLTAIAGVAEYYAMLRLWRSVGIATCGGVLFGFGTEVSSIASQGLWEQTGAVLWLAVLLLVGAWITERPDEPWLYVAAGGAAGMTALCRPQDVLLAGPILLGIVWLGWRRGGGGRRSLLLEVLGGLPLLVVEVGYNEVAFGSVLRTGYASRASGVLGMFSNPLGSGLVGLLLSPSKGWVVYNPWIILPVVVGVCLVVRVAVRRVTALPRGGYLVTSGVVGVTGYVCLMAVYYQWPGGYTFGPRYELDAVPVLVMASVWSALVIMMDAGEDVWGMRLSRLREVAGSAIVITCCWSMLLQGAGTYVLSGYNWNLAASEDDIFSWQGSQMMYYLRALSAELFPARLSVIQGPVEFRGPVLRSGVTLLNSSPGAARVTCLAPNSLYWGYVTVVNRGEQKLSAFPDGSGVGEMVVSYHVYKSGRLIAYDGEAIHLLWSIPPGGRRLVQFQITTPTKAGTYEYVITGLQEGVRWLQQGQGPGDSTVMELTVSSRC